MTWTEHAVALLHCHAVAALVLGDCAITRGEQLAMVECQDVVSEPVISDQLSMNHLLGHDHVSQIIWWWVIPLPFAPLGYMRCWNSGVRSS